MEGIGSTQNATEYAFGEYAVRECAIGEDAVTWRHPETED
jgi:hypothetical protein